MFSPLTTSRSYQQREAPIKTSMEVKGEISTGSCMLDQDKMGSSFMECSICLDAAAEPVVTLCGHLYCWPCIYEWMKKHTGDCPVCKSRLSRDAIIPIYGRGRSNTNSTKIPDRPSPRPMVVHDQHQQKRYDYGGGYMSSASVLHSTAGAVLCGMADAVIPWVSGGSHEGRMYNSSPYVIGSNAGTRRMQEMRIESYLNQIWSFFFCCAILCFLFF